jgi:hypothetical protein
MKLQTALVAGIAAAAVLGSAAVAATPTQGLSRLYASDVQGEPQNVVHDAASAYAWLASLNGSEWKAVKTGGADLPKASSGDGYAGGGDITKSTFKTIAAGSTVMEVYLPGSPAEMTIMYHMDGPATLLANHFCAARNVPQWKFVKSDKPGVIAFVYDGGTNINPSVDTHAHAATYRVIDKDHFEQINTNSAGGKLVTVSSIQARMPAPIKSASAE